MKKIIFLLSFIVIAGCSWAQQNPNVEHLAPYRMLTTDSAYVTPANLKKNKPVMLIYFSPDCSHCQHLMYEMKPKMKEFSNVQIVMITFTSLKMVKNFYHDFGLSAYPNIIMGTEGYTYNVQRYYQIQTTPFIAIYDHNGKLVKAFPHVPKIEELIETAKKA